MTQKDREPTSFNCDVNHKEWMDREIPNKSDFLNKLISTYRDGGNLTESEVAQLRKRELDTEIKSLERKLELKRAEREDLDQSTQTPEEEREELWQQAVANLSFEDTQTFGTVVKSSENAVQQWADRLNMDISEFKAEVIDRYDG